jgi:hypothetical protein
MSNNSSYYSSQYTSGYNYGSGQGRYGGLYRTDNFQRDNAFNTGYLDSKSGSNNFNSGMGSYYTNGSRSSSRFKK